MSACSYVRANYGVPAEIGRVVVVNGKQGVIAKDRGHYIGVNFDEDKPGVISPCHPTWRVIYKDEIVVPRKLTRSQQRYLDYLRSECAESFGEWFGCK